MSERSDDYAAVTAMVRELRTFDPDSAQYRRAHAAIIDLTLPLASHIARRFRGRGQSHEDLFQVASVGLVQAVKRFDPDNGSEFLAFAIPTMMGEVRRYFRDCGWAVKVPRRLKELNNQLKDARSELSQRLGRAPTPSEMALHLGIDREELIQATIASSNYATVSTDAGQGQSGEFLAIRETLGQRDSRLDKVLDVETIRPLITSLPAREQAILRMRFFEEMTQTEIAERIGCSQMHISRLLSSALAKLRNQAGEPTARIAGAAPVLRRRRRHDAA
ncbi:SigB/SigF/SigG family RNA polymerase sigma factor [Mycolicibacterium iranicum]|nr:SigB/SigF/SigG family RNA polymerase sigma factor [Mycolicibacterium iranicum]